MKNKDIDEIFFYSTYTTVDYLRKKITQQSRPQPRPRAQSCAWRKSRRAPSLYTAWQWIRTSEYFQLLITSIKVHQFSKVIRVLKSAHPQLFVGGVYFYFLLRIFMLDSAEVNFCRKTAAKNWLHQLSSIKNTKESKNKHYQQKAEDVLISKHVSLLKIDELLCIRCISWLKKNLVDIFIFHWVRDI